MTTPPDALARLRKLVDFEQSGWEPEAPEYARYVQAHADIALLERTLAQPGAVGDSCPCNWTHHENPLCPKYEDSYQLATPAAVGEAVAWLRHTPEGLPDWAEDCIAQDDHFLDSDLEREGYTLRPLIYAATRPAPGREGFYLATFKQRSRDGAVMWWQADNRGYTTDLEQAGIYTDLIPGYHDSEDTVPVPVAVIERLRVRRVVDYGDSLNTGGIL